MPSMLAPARLQKVQGIAGLSCVHATQIDRGRPHPGNEPIRASSASIMPASPECSSALRFGATYCASSANMRARNSTGFFLFIAIRAIPVMGSQRSTANLSATSRVRLLGVPRWRPPRRSPGFDPPPAILEGIPCYLSERRQNVAAFAAQWCWKCASHHSPFHGKG
jgi:hypothetical protein